MKELIEKISSYNLFNYLLPGTLFAALGEQITTYKLIQKDIIIALFLYYFIGLVISRIGSLVLEPLMKKTSFVTFAPYKDFVAVSTKDQKIETLSEVNNMYRTLCSLSVAVGGLKLYEWLSCLSTWVAQVGPYVFFVLLFALFSFSYRKQTNYITKRIEAGKDEHC